jgi:hypothetical protein
MITVGIVSLGWTEREIVNVGWDPDGNGIRGGVPAHDNYIWISLDPMGQGLANDSLLLRSLGLLMLMPKVGQIQRSRLMSFNLKSIPWHWPSSTFS